MIKSDAIEATSHRMNGKVTSLNFSLLSGSN